MRKVQDFSYHNHTDFSDGADTLAMMVAQAKKIGYTEMGISDHLIIHKNIHQSISLPLMTDSAAGRIYMSDFKSNLAKYQKRSEEIRRLSQQENIKLYVGMEVDFFTYDGWLEELKDFLSQLDYDYIISGNHFLTSEDGEDILLIHSQTPKYVSSSKLKELISIHFDNIRKSIDCELFKFVAHLDYVRKLGSQHYAPEDFESEITAVLDALQKHDSATEFSTKGLRKSSDYYPTSYFMSEIARRNIKVVISDDAHCQRELGYGFAAAEEDLAKYGVTNRLRF